MAFVVKQPNGRYCRFSTVTSCPSHYNMTEEDYLRINPHEGDLVLKNHLKPFVWVIESFSDANMEHIDFLRILANMYYYDGEMVVVCV